MVRVRTGSGLNSRATGRKQKGAKGDEGGRGVQKGSKRVQNVAKRGVDGAVKDHNT